MEVRMDGRNAIVTGGSLGLGKAVAMEFARSGAHVALVARRQGPLDQAKAEIEKVGAGKVIAVAADIRLAGDCRRAVAGAPGGRAGHPHRTVPGRPELDSRRRE